MQDRPVPVQNTGIGWRNKITKTLGTIKYGIIETGKTIIDEIKMKFIEMK